MTAGRKSISTIKDWCTPQEYIDLITDFFGGEIAFDPCSNAHSLVKAKVEWQLPIDALQKPWPYDTIFVNPPYGRDQEQGTTIKQWLLKCSEAAQLYYSEVIALIPVATNTKHWQENIFLTATSICFLKVPRFKFMYAGSLIQKGAPMACCLVYWGANAEGFHKHFSHLGKIVVLL